MNKLLTWYKNLNLSVRVIFSMNAAILLSILIISVFATINRINVQKNEANVLVSNELNQIVTLLDFLQDRPLMDLEPVIHRRSFYHTGFISIVDRQGNVLVCPNRQGSNIAGTAMFNQLRNYPQGQYVYNDPFSGERRYQYHTTFPPLNLYVTATLDKSEFIDKPVFNTLKILFFALLFTWITFSITNYYIMRTVTKPIHKLVALINEMGKGDISGSFDYPSKDEVGQMTASVNGLLKGLRDTTLFSKAIGEKNFDHSYEPLSDKDVLGNALLEMRERLKAADYDEKVRKIEDEKRNWTTQGLAKFADILRQNNNDIYELSYDIIRNLVDYLEVNQGGIFILNKDEETQEKYLEMTACYAYSRRKFTEKRILPGEGLVGTCYLEQETIYLTKIPKGYIQITSGLGGDNPGSLLLIPLKINNEIYGVMELASFTEFEKYRLEFVEKIGESIASTIAGVKINMRTAALLSKSQQQAEEMRAQEEEMRQNMEELAATQEAMAEKERENQQMIDSLTEEAEKNTTLINKVKDDKKRFLEIIPDGLVQYTPQGDIVFFNKGAEKLLGMPSSSMEGINILTLFNPDNDLVKDLVFRPSAIPGEVLWNDITIAHSQGSNVSLQVAFADTPADDQPLFSAFFIKKDDATFRKDDNNDE